MGPNPAPLDRVTAERPPFASLARQGLLFAASKCALGMGSAHGCRIFVVEDGVLWTADAQRKRLQWTPTEAGLTGHVFLSGSTLALTSGAHEHKTLQIQYFQRRVASPLDKYSTFSVGLPPQ